MLPRFPVSPALAQTVRTPAPMALQRARRLVSPELTPAGLVEILYDAPAIWARCDFGMSKRGGDVRHQTLRDGGVAPDYPVLDAVLGGTVGALRLTSVALTLTPDSKDEEVISVTPTTLQRVVFYSDVFEIEITGYGILAISAGRVEQIDAIFQAYFWPKALPIRG